MKTLILIILMVFATTVYPQKKEITVVNKTNINIVSIYLDNLKPKNWKTKWLFNEIKNPIPSGTGKRIIKYFDRDWSNFDILIKFENNEASFFGSQTFINNKLYLEIW